MTLIRLPNSQAIKGNQYHTHICVLQTSVTHLTYLRFVNKSTQIKIFYHLSFSKADVINAKYASNLMK